MTPQPGDIVARRKGLVMHKGLVLRDGRILHNTPRRGEHVSSWQEFSAGRRVAVSRPVRSVVADPPNQRRGYHLLRNNCEHTVSRAMSGEAESPQLRSWAVGIGVATVAFAITRHPGVTAAGYALGRKLGAKL